MARVLVNQAWTLEVGFTDEGGHLEDPDDTGAVAFDVLDGTGTSVQSGTATQEAAGIFQFTLDPQADLDEFTVQWSADFDGATRTVETQADVVGSRLTDLRRLREDPELEDLPDRILARTAIAAEDWFTEALNYPMYRRSARVGMAYPGGTRLIVPGILKPLAVINVDRNGTQVNASEQARMRARSSWLELQRSQTDPRATEFAHGWYDFHVEHGVPFAPGDVTRAAAILARYLGRSVNYPERASQVVTDGAVISFSIPAPNRPTGIPEVDAVIVRHAIPNTVGFPTFG